MKSTIGTLSSVAAALCLSAAFATAEETGVSNDKILFGQVAALEGPASALGTGMNLGIRAAFEEANKSGGVNGRKLELISADDGYEPNKTIKQTNRMIKSKKVFALIGPVGTPTSRVGQPIATESGVPFIGPFTGAGFLRDASHGNIVNFRATYDAETEAWIRYLVDQKKYRKIAILYQDDAFGRVGLSGVNKALTARGMELVAEANYRRNTQAVKIPLLKLRKSKPDAIVMVGAYKPIAQFVRVAKSIDFAPEFITISFVGSAALAKELGKDGEGVIISQVVPDPWDEKLQVVADYHAAIKAVDPEAKPDFVSLEGYIVGRLATTAAQNAGADLNRKRFLDAVWKLNSFDLGGISLNYGPADNQGSDDVFMTQLQADGTFEPLETLGY